MTVREGVPGDGLRDGSHDGVEIVCHHIVLIALDREGPEELWHGDSGRV